MKKAALEQQEGIELVQILSRRVKELQDANSSLRDHIFLRDSAEQAVNKEFRAQLQRKDNAIAKLLNSESLSEVELLKKRVEELENVNVKLREHILLRDSVERAMKHEFGMQVQQKEQIISRLKEHVQMSTTEPHRIEKELLPEIELLRQECGMLRQRLDEKAKELERVRKIYKENEQANYDFHSQMQDQINERNSQIGKLKSFIAQREDIFQRIEEQLTNQILAKDSEIRLLRHTKTPRSEHLERSMEQARQIVGIKEAALKKLYAEVLKLKEAAAELQRSLNAEKQSSGGMKLQYEKIISALKRDNDRTVQGLISEHSLRQTADRTEIENLKAQLAAASSQIKIEKLKIDGAIKEFGIRTQQLIVLRGQEVLSEQVIKPEPAVVAAVADVAAVEGQMPMKNVDDLQEYAKKAKLIREGLNKREIELAKREADMNKKGDDLAQKEAEVKGMLTSVEQRLKDVERKEDSLDTREKILLRQQEAFNVELGKLEKAGYSLNVESSDLEKQLKQGEKKGEEGKAEQERSSQEVKQMEAINTELVVPVVEEIKPKKRIKELIPLREEKITKPKAIKKVEQPDKIADTFNLQDQTLGQSEVDEIMSMIDIALQNNDTVEQVTKSLCSSGYSKENVEKALKKMKLA